ncbi:hypothetical protein J5690_00135 [bacterium]|nr:hypothetical protein [bacterium]
MPAYVHADSDNIKKGRIRIFSNSRMISTKMQTLFSGELVVYICMILAAASLMLVDSYYKAYKNNLEVKIVRMLNDTRDLEWQKSVSEHTYFQMTSSSELMKKASEMKLSVATSDKFMKFN